MRTRLLAPIAVAAGWEGLTLVAAIRPLAGIALSEDGSRLAALWCGVKECALQVLDLDTGFRRDVRFDNELQDLYGFAVEGVALSGGCVELPAGVMRASRCERPDQAAANREVAANFAIGVELPTGWALDFRPDPDAEPLSFSLEAIAVPADGSEPVVLEAVGPVSGQ